MLGLSSGFKISVSVRAVYCTRVAQVAERQHLRSTQPPVVPRFQLDTYGRRTFAVAGPTTWNQNNLREPDMQIDCSGRTLKTVSL